MNYEGNKGPLHLKEAIYRIDGQSGALAKVADDIAKPNGICFSPDYKKLYVADTGATHYPDAERMIKVWDVDGATLRKRPQVHFDEAGWVRPGRTGRRHPL